MRHLLSILALALLAPAVRAGDEPAPSSALLSPLFLGEEPPPLRTLGAIWMPHADVEGIPESVSRSREQVLSDARALIESLRAGGDWEEHAARYSAARNRSSGSVMGTFPPGVLAPQFDDFLAGAEVGDVSDPIEHERGIFVLSRLGTQAACRVLMVRGNDEAARARAEDLVRRAREGADFAELAREHSDHAGTRDAGGAWTVFERGSRDSLLKLAVFRTPVGGVTDPLEVAGSLYVAKRVPEDELDASLFENNWIRVRALALAFDGATPGLRPDPREPLEAMELAYRSLQRIAEGEDMAALVRELGDDAGVRESGGDLGWIHRHQPGLSRPFQLAFLVEPGELVEPKKLDLGIVVVRRER